MCPPPLACPLCASAGGFTSPGALWLGLIGVANRLLSCPVCHELLLGLDKLTIHLVSHVPDLNLLASSIGNHVNINQKTNDEHTVIQHLTSKEHCTNFNARNTTSNRKKQSLPRVTTEVKEISSTQSNGLSATREDDYFDQKIILNRLYLDQVQGSINPASILSFSPLNKTKDDHEMISAARREGKFPESLSSKSTQEISKDKMPEDSSSIQMAGILRKKDNFEVPTTNILQNLPPGRKNKYFMEIQNDSYCLTQSLPQPSEKIIPVAEPVYQQKSPLIQENSNQWINYEKRCLESRGKHESQSENGDVKTRCDTCFMNFDDPKCEQLHSIMVHPSEELLNTSLCQTTSHTLNNFPCQLCNRNLSSNSDLLVHMRFAHSVVPGNSPDDNLEKKIFPAESAENGESLNTLSGQECQNQSIISDKLQSKNTEVVEVNLKKITPKFHEEAFPGKSDQVESIFADRQNNSNDSVQTTDNENSQDTNKEEYSNGSPPLHYAVDDETKHACKICDMHFCSVADLIAHRPVHIEENGCICVVCGKSFKKEQHLQQHLRTHEGKQWECDVCCKFFTTKYFLKKHKRLHTGEMPYCCETCGKTFTFQQSYHKHLLYHSDEKPHACNECGKRFKELSTLHNHERIHTGEKPFTCESCGKAFRQRVSYLVHRRIHTGVMPYKCTACEKSFRYKVSQRTHKCSSQQVGTVVRQSSDLVERLLSHQKEKSTTNEHNKQSKVTFTDTGSEHSLTNNKKYENMENLTEFSPSRVTNDQSLESFHLDSNSIHPDSVILNDSQNANSSFMDDISSEMSRDLCTSRKPVGNFEPALICETGGIEEHAFHFRQAMENGASRDKNSGPSPVNSESKVVSSAVPEIVGRSTSECNSNYVFNFNSPCKLQHIPALNSDNTEGKGMVIQGNDNASGEDFDSSIFPSTSLILSHTDSDFFTLVMPQADPALEKLGKLSISSVHSPEKSNSGSNSSESHYHDACLQKVDSTSKEDCVSSSINENGFNDHCAGSKNSILEIDHCPELSRDQDSANNAADLSSFLQSCLEQWHPSNFIANGKDKDGTGSHDSQQPSINRANPCPTNAEDNRLHTINEESLRRLLYGDNVP